MVYLLRSVMYSLIGKRRCWNMMRFKNQIIVSRYLILNKISNKFGNCLK